MGENPVFLSLNFLTFTKCDVQLLCKKDAAHCSDYNVLQGKNEVGLSGTRKKGGSESKRFENKLQKKNCLLFEDLFHHLDCVCLIELV